MAVARESGTNLWAPIETKTQTCVTPAPLSHNKITHHSLPPSVHLLIPPTVGRKVGGSPIPVIESSPKETTNGDLRGRNSPSPDSIFKGVRISPCPFHTFKVKTRLSAGLILDAICSIHRSDLHLPICVSSPREKIKNTSSPLKPTRETKQNILKQMEVIA